MTMSSALSTASSGLANINAQLALLSQNIANAATPSYAVETSTQQSLTASGVGLGVHTSLPTRSTDQALQATFVQQNGSVASLQTTQAALQAIDPILGTPGQGTDLGSLVGKLQDSFSTLLNDPANQPQQSAVMSAAANLAQNINTLSQAYSTQRQTAQDNLGTAVSTLNNTLGTISDISNQIVIAKASSQSTADLENQRDAAVQTLSSLLDVKTSEQPDGGMSIFTPSGVALLTSGTPSPLKYTGGSTPPGSYYPGGGLSGLTLNGIDVTGQMVGGQIGANLTLRDTTLPTAQGQLDEFAQGLSNRFAAQGLTLFSDANGNVPSAGGTPAQAGYIGYAAAIQVNPAVTANPSLIRDGTDAIAAAAGGASAFTPNPSGGPAGFADLITRVINNTFSNQVQPGVPQPAFSTTGLGPKGNLSAPLNAMGSLGDYASSFVSAQSLQSSEVSNNLTTATALQTSLSTKISNRSGVNMDTELSQMLVLQNAYSANARVLNAIQAMFTQLLQAVQ